MRGSITLRILETVAGMVCDTADLTVAILESGYGASMSKIQYKFNKLQRQRESENFNNEEKQRFYKLLYNLKTSGLIQKNEKQSWLLTQKGFKKLERLKFLFTRGKYSKHKKEEDGTFKIVAFDVPEKYKHKRAWLREVLGNIGFKMLQRSVWMGKVQLPEYFVKDLNNLGLTPYVEIFSINKTGTLKQIS